MKKIIFLICMSITIFAQETKFSIISVGNLKGNYRNIDSLKVALDIKNKEKIATYDNVIKLNIGNNMSEYPVKNELMETFVKKVGFNFNFFGKEEFLWKEYIDVNKIPFSTINIVSKAILPYQLMKMDDKIVCIAGITNIYEDDIKGKIPYKRELQNLMYMVEDNVDFFFLVTDLDRDENARILKEFPMVNGIFESRDTLYDFGVATIDTAEGPSYIIPNYGISITDFSYMEKEEKKTVKKASLKLRENILEPQKYGYDKDLTSYINWANERVKNENSLIVGYNNDSYNPYEIFLREKVNFLDDLSDKLIKDFASDVVIFPKKSLFKGLKKGLYTSLEVQEMFAKEKFISFTVPYDKLKKIIDRNSLMRGKEEYFYISGLDKHPLQKEYKILSFENFLIDYKDIIGKDYTVEKVGIREYLIKK
ncbi:MAG: hypothetical protein KBE24_06660 [Fusobacteriaceae bacterium]|nr:hypothetical protein [Fusobacteriaceae bacterium]MBP9596446.1 hypothetical protein [Fusobacteriaceae bacterium]MBU9918766.1 hypothetical protein [Fusobacteriaceae bacterium]